MTREPEVVPTRAQVVAHWFFSDSSGELVLGQPPNLAIKVAFGLRVSQWALRRGGLRRGSPLDSALERVGRAAFVWWSLDELVRGTTPYRRSIGAAGLVYALRQGGRQG